MTAPAPSRRAVMLAVLGGLLTFTAALFDAEPLYVPGVLFLFISTGALLWVWVAARGILVERTVAAPTVAEEQPLDVKLVIRAQHGLLPAGTLRDPLLDGEQPLTAGHRQTTIHVNASFSRRGRRILAAPTVTVRDPFGIAEREVTGGGEHEVLVLPAVSDVVLLSSASGSDVLGDRPARTTFAAEVELDGLRPHRPGASASRISWAAYARSGELMERRLRPDGDSRPIVVLDPRATPGDGLDALDAAVRATASLCVHLARRGGCSLLLPGDRRPILVDPTLAGWPRLHVRLAVLEAGLAPPPLSALTGRRGTVVYVTARPLARPPRALQQTRGGGQVLVVPGAMPGRAPAFVVAGCTGYDLTAKTRRVGVG